MNFILYSAHIYSSACVFHLKCPSVKEKSAKVSSGNCVLQSNNLAFGEHARTVGDQGMIGSAAQHGGFRGVFFVNPR